MSVPARYIWFFLGVIVLLISLQVSSTTDFQSISKSYFLNDETHVLTKKLDEQYVNIRSMQRILIEKLKENQRFSFEDNQYPAFLFENGCLIHWNSHKLIISEEQFLEGNDEVVFIEGDYGVYMLVRHFFKLNQAKYALIHVVPCYTSYHIENHYVQSSFNNDLFRTTPKSIRVTPEKGYSSIKVREARIFVEWDDKHPLMQLNYWILVAGVMFFVSTCVFTMIQSFRYANKAWVQLLDWFIGLGCIRLVLLKSGLPVLVFPQELFDARYFSSSDLSPSLGDLFLNLLFVVLFISFTFYKCWNERLFVQIRRVESKWIYVAAFLLFLVSHVSGWLVHDVLENIYVNSQWLFDVTKQLVLNGFEVVYLICFLMVVYLFGLSHLVLWKMVSIASDKVKKGLKIMFLTSVVPVMVLIIWMPEHYVIFVILSVLFGWSVWIIFNSSRVSTGAHGLYLFTVLTVAVCSLGAAYTIFVHSKGKDHFNKHRFAEQLLSGHDMQGEYLLSKIAGRIQKDPMLLQFPENNSSILELNTERLKRVYFNDYFDKYDVYIHWFDERGNNFDSLDTYSSIEEYVSSLSPYKTEYSGLYFQNDIKNEFLSKYTIVSSVKSKNAPRGYVVVELMALRIKEYSVLPVLLQEKRLYTEGFSVDYNFAVIEKGVISFSHGEYNYRINDFRPTDFKGLSHVYENGFSHLLVNDGGDKSVIVSSPDNSFNIILTNFSFLFLVCMSFLFVGVLGYTVIYRYRFGKTSFITKLNVFLNVAFVLPLILVSFFMLKLISDSDEHEMERAFLDKGIDMARVITPKFEMWLSGHISKDELFKDMLERSEFAETELNIFDVGGRMALSTQPLLIQSNLFSDRISVKAKELILDQKHDAIIRNEKIGEFKLKSVYVSLRSAKEGTVIGILGVPFYNSRFELAQNRLQILGVTINVFSLVFLVILFLSNVAIRSLTAPLLIITDRLKHTVLGVNNKPLEWKTQDEIGLLVKGYNNMLAKLEDSRQALARNEKESAWREMAQQVAHEIKNPLTPMKLTLQHLLRRLKSNSSEQMVEVSKSVETLLDQIDNLSDIATSFSEFAKMPIPKNHPFEFIEVVKSTTRLYEGNEKIKVEVRLVDREVWVNGDENLISRIITNLILNAIQAVSIDKVPYIQIDTSVEKGELLLSIKDNGVGIPEDIRTKVFLPNFSTKFSGSGIGLAVAKRGIEHAGGKIWFDTSESGTTFYVQLPVLDALI